jgi:hypothetical protein
VYVLLINKNDIYITLVKLTNYTEFEVAVFLLLHCPIFVLCYCVHRVVFVVRLYFVFILAVYVDVMVYCFHLVVFCFHHIYLVLLFIRVYFIFYVTIILFFRILNICYRLLKKNNCYRFSFFIYKWYEFIYIPSEYDMYLWLGS